MRPAGQGPSYCRPSLVNSPSLNDVMADSRRSVLDARRRSSTPTGSYRSSTPRLSSPLAESPFSRQAKIVPGPGDYEASGSIAEEMASPSHSGFASPVSSRYTSPAASPDASSARMFQLQFAKHMDRF